MAENEEGKVVGENIALCCWLVSRIHVSKSDGCPLLEFSIYMRHHSHFCLRKALQEMKKSIMGHLGED